MRRHVGARYILTFTTVTPIAVTTCLLTALTDCSSWSSHSLLLTPGHMRLALYGPRLDFLYSSPGPQRQRFARSTRIRFTQGLSTLWRSYLVPYTRAVVQPESRQKPWEPGESSVQDPQAGRLSSSNTPTEHRTSEYHQQRPHLPRKALSQFTLLSLPTLFPWRFSFGFR